MTHPFDPSGRPDHGTAPYGSSPYHPAPPGTYPYAGGPSYGAPPPGYPMPGYPMQPPVPDKRPGSVIAAAVVLIVMGVLVGLLRLVAPRSPMGEGMYAAGQMIGVALVLLAAMAAVITGILLLTMRSRTAPVLATIAAVLLVFTCIGVVATIAVPILLWAQDAARAWFAPPPASGPYGTPTW